MDRRVRPGRDARRLPLPLHGGRLRLLPVPQLRGRGALADALGVDLAKPAELTHWYRDPSGRYLTGGWFHVVGRIVAGADTHPNEDGTGDPPYELLAPDVYGGFARHAALVAQHFAGQPVVQWEFQTLVPWVLDQDEPPL